MKQFALHSTMFLLIQRCSICLSYCYTTLHSTMFLLILDGEEHDAKLLFFTFHNVSINTERSNMNFTRDCHFTFHNVSINTKAGYKVGIYCNTLHSTMFLLILLSRDEPQLLLFYFTFHNVSINTHCSERANIPFCHFTFHNVSINTAFACSSSSGSFTLHSTMFLLIPNQ